MIVGYIFKIIQKTSRVAKWTTGEVGVLVERGEGLFVKSNATYRLMLQIPGHHVLCERTVKEPMDNEWVGMIPLTWEMIVDDM